MLLEAKAKKIQIRKDPEKISQTEYRTIFDHTDDRSWHEIFARALVRPLRLFVFEPIVQLLGLYMAFIYGVFYRESTSETFGRLLTPHSASSVLDHNTSDFRQHIPSAPRDRGAELHRPRHRPYTLLPGQRPAVRQILQIFQEAQ